MASSEFRGRVVATLRDPRATGLLVAPLVVLGGARAFGSATPGLLFLAAFAAVAAGFWFGPLAAALEAAYLGVLLLPALRLVDLQVVTTTHIRWWTAALFFALLGVATGAASRRLRRRLAAERAYRLELTRVHARSLMTFARLVAERDQPTAHHCERVAENARTLGRAYGLEGHALGALYWAGLLHDLGKISTPASILLKEGALTSHEYDVIKRHADKGAEVLLHISDRFHHIAEGVRSHHERWDGSGYPRGLSGTDIPLFGRLLAVADVFEAMTAPRPYRGPMPTHEVLRHLQVEAGRHFDPEIVALFRELLQDSMIRTYDDGLPAPAQPDDAIASDTFWRAQGRGPAVEDPLSPAA